MAITDHLRSFVLVILADLEVKLKRHLCASISVQDCCLVPHEVVNAPLGCREHAERTSLGGQVPTVHLDGQQTHTGTPKVSKADSPACGFVGDGFRTLTFLFDRHLDATWFQAL